MSASLTIRLGTRSSPLARWQADWVTARLQELGAHVEQVLISTQGDVTSGPIGSFGGQGVFTKEIQRALLDDRVDLAVHSMKDLPTEQVPGLTIAAIPVRETVGDVLVSATGLSVIDLPVSARIGTGSTRRQAQLLHVRPDLQLSDLRGNVETRLRRLDSGDFDAIVLAEAGLKRLGLSPRIVHVIPTEQMLPAVGQGALALEVRADDQATLEFVRRLDDATSRAGVLAERAFLSALRGGCLAPVGALSGSREDELVLAGVVLSADGRQRLWGERQGKPAEAAALGVALAEELLNQGARELIAGARA
ncbi:MAG: hydroxymethylbilane synthase [Planctomycetota bacterium]